MKVQRFDYSALENPVARKDGDGFLHDSPVVGRIGIQEYRKADGTIRRELRLPEEVFAEDALSSFVGKPITVDHPSSGRVTSKDAHRFSVGTMLAKGRQDGETVRADIVIHSPDSIGDRRQLSLGYTARVDETPGEWNGQKYDAIQRDIRVNHLSVVKVARAGAIARLNLDSSDNEIPLNDSNINPTPEHQNMNVVKVKLDSGIEYDAAPEIAAELAKVRADASEARAKLETETAKLTAKADGLQAKVDSFPAELEKAIKDGEAKAQARVKLDAVAASFKIDGAEKMTEREVKEAVIKATRKDADLTGKSDVYIDAAFDIAVELKSDFAMASQRNDVLNAGKPGGVHVSADERYQDHMDNLSNFGKKEEGK
jgi:hypothetical protein